MNMRTQNRVILRLCLTSLFMAGVLFAVRTQQAWPAQSSNTHVTSLEDEQESVALPKLVEIQSAPVAPFHSTIFFVHSRLGPFTPAERAERLERIIRQLGRNNSFSPTLIKIVQNGTTLEIIYDDTVVMSVSDGDAEYLQKSKEDIAAEYRDNIARAIVQHRHYTELPSILIKMALVLLILVAFFFIIKYVNRLFMIVRRKLVALRGTYIKGIRVKSYSLLDEDKCIVVLLFFIKIIKYLTLLAILYFFLPLLFSVFPETRGLAGTLWDYILTPFSEIVIAVKNYLPKAVAITVIVTLFRYLAKGAKYFAGEIEKGKLVIKGFYPDWAAPTCNIVRTLLFIFMFIVIFQYLPYSDSRVFQGVSVFIGVLVSLGSTALVGNMVAGLALTYMRPFHVGDFVKIGETAGTVIEKAPLAIRIMTIKNEDITIPNSNIMSVHTVNYSQTARENKLILYTAVTFGYDTPWRKVHELLLSAAAQTPHVLAEPAPFVLQRALDNFFAEYQINVYIAEEKLMPRIYSELYENIQDAFKDAGIDITTPAYQSFRGKNRIQITQ